MDKGTFSPGSRIPPPLSGIDCSEAMQGGMAVTPLIFVPGRERELPNYSSALHRAGGLPRFSFDPAEAADCWGLLLPGGGDPDPALYGQADRGSHPPDRRRDLLELALLRRFLSDGKPVLGICRGLQMINVFFGGTLLQDIPGHGQIRAETGCTW